MPVGILTGVTCSPGRGWSQRASETGRKTRRSLVQGLTARLRCLAWQIAHLLKAWRKAGNRRFRTSEVSCSSGCLSGRSRCKASRRCDTAFEDTEQTSRTDRFQRSSRHLRIMSLGPALVTIGGLDHFGTWKHPESRDALAPQTIEGMWAPKERR